MLNENNAPFSYMMNLLNKTWFKKPTFHICCRILYITLFSLFSITREGSDWLRDCAIHKPIRVLPCNP